MIKKVLLIALVVILLIAVIEVSALINEKRTLKSFAQYWTAQNKTATGSFRYVALGDSAAQGIGADDPQKGYVGVLAKRIAAKTGQKVQIINLSKSGARLHDAIDDQVPLVAGYKPDLVTIEIGANDITGYDDAQFTKQFKQLVSLLPQGTYVSNMPYFGGIVRSEKNVLVANQHITQILKDSGMHLVNMHDITKSRQGPRNYAVDLFHPSVHGYQNWADAFWKEIEPQLTSAGSSASIKATMPS